MKIPKSINAALDWAGQNIRVVAAVGTAVIVSVLFWWIPLLSAFVLGFTVGGIVVHMRMVPRQKALRADVDDLLRQNGALRREKLTLASGVISRQSQLTAKLPVIPDGPDDRAVPDSPGGRAAPEGPDDKVVLEEPADRAVSEAVSEEPDDRVNSRQSRLTTTLPVIADDAGDGAGADDPDDRAER